jgi:hypothetical protein
MLGQALTDIDALSLAVRDRESRRLILEAIAAYRGGALRSAIASTWIAVAYDIISKARELATQGEAAAKAFVDGLDAAITRNDIRKLQTIESTLLDAANDDLQLFAPHEFEAMRRLQADRNLCVHPAFVVEDELYQPTQELVRSHIVHGLQYLLIHAPLQGKSAVTRFEADILSPSFPGLATDIGTFLRSKYLDRAKDVLVANLIKGSLVVPFGAERAKFVGRERLLALALGEIAKAKAAIYETVVPPFVGHRFEAVADDVLLKLCTYLDVDPRIWQWLSEPVRLRIRTLIENADLEALKTFSVFDAFVVPELADALMARFDAFDENTQISIIAEHPRREFVGRAIQIYGGSGSYRTAEVLGQTLIVRLASHFCVEDIQQLLDVAAANGQIIGAAGTRAILASVFDATRRLLPECRAGWQAFVDDMTAQQGGDQAAYYAYPGIRERLNAA